MTATTRRPATSGIAPLALLALVASVGAPLEVSSQDGPRGRDEAREVIDALVIDERLVSLEREPCDETRPFEAGECASLLARDPASGRELWRTRMPIRVRGLIQLEPASADGAGAGFLLRAHDRAVLVEPGGRASAPFDVPTSTLPHPVGVEEARGAFVFREHGGCGSYVVGRTEVRSGGRYLRGVESHVYGPGGGPHDTVCFGFGVRPIAELRVGTRPAPRGARGELRHAISTLVLVATTRLRHPVDAPTPSVIAFGPRGVAYQVAVGDAGSVIESVSASGDDARARCTVDTSDGTAHRRVVLECATGRVLSRSVVPPAPDADGPDAGSLLDAGDPVVGHDRRGIALPRFPRCLVEERGGRFRVLFDGAPVLESARRILVLDQRADACAAVELAEATHPTDTLHRFTR